MENLHNYTFEYACPPGPPTIGISYSTGIIAPSPRTPSSGLLKRKRSESSMTITAITVTVHPDGHPGPIILPDVNHNADEPYVAPPSPVPTEIVEEFVEEDCEERMEAAKAAGVKVRDFAYEPVPRNPDNGQDLRAPKVWQHPLEALVEHDCYIRTHPPHAGPRRLSGRKLHNLLAIGWVTPEEAQAHWQPEDWAAVDEYKKLHNNNPYPVRIFASKKKPTWAYRAALRAQAYRPADDDVPEECIVRPMDEPGMDDGPKRVSDEELWAMRPEITPRPPSPCATHTVLASPSPSPSRSQSRVDDDVHADKRRRVSGTPTPTPLGSHGQSASFRADTPTPTPTPPASPSPGASFELARADTPPVEEPKAPVRQSRRIQRTQTLASIFVR